MMKNISMSAVCVAAILCIALQTYPVGYKATPCMMLVDGVRRGDPDPKIQADLDRAKAEASNAKDAGRAQKRIDVLQKRADDSCPTILQVVAWPTAGEGKPFACECASDRGNAAQKMVAGDYAAGTIRVVEWVSGPGGEWPWEVKGLKKTDEPKAHPEVRDVIRRWEKPDASLDDASSELTIATGAQRMDGVERIAVPMRITNNGTKTIAVARAIIEAADDAGFVQKERRIVLRDLKPNDSMELTWYSMAGDAAGLKPRIRLCFVEYAATTASQPASP